MHYKKLWRHFVDCDWLIGAFSDKAAERLTDQNRKAELFGLIDRSGAGELITIYDSHGPSGVGLFMESYAAEWMYEGGAGRKFGLQELMKWVSEKAHRDANALLIMGGRWSGLSLFTMFSVLKAKAKFSHLKKQDSQADFDLDKLITAKNGGLLVDIYVWGHEVELRKYMTKTINRAVNEEETTISREDWVLYQVRSRQKQLVDGAPVKPEKEAVKEYKAHSLVRFEEHEICWKLNFRGPSGETALHICYLNNSPLHSDIARIMLDMYPKLALDIYEGEEYYGESALHICIVYGDLDSAKLLIEKGANIHQRATGKFFLPEDQKKKRTKNTNYEGYAYYGEYPLSFAACFGQESIYDYLIANGANPNSQDSFGNTVLHMVVITNQLDMYSYAARHPISPANTWIKNDEGLTPLALASKLGRHKIFNEIMELHRIELWRFSNINCSYYPLHAIDTIGPGGDTNWNSALMITVNGETDEHLEMLQGGVIKQLLDEKWRTFVRARFFQRLVMALAHLVFLSIAIYTRPKKDLLSCTTARDGVRLTAEIIVIGSCLATFLMQMQEVKTLGFLLFLKALKNAPSKAIFLIACILLMLCVPIRLAQFSSLADEQYTRTLQLSEETLLIVALPASWTFLLFFAKAHGSTGHAVMMFYRIVQTDMVTFAVIYVIFIVCIAQGFYFLFRDIAKASITRFKTPLGSLMSLFHMTLGDFDYEEFEEVHYPPLAKILFAIFMILMPILLLNMLIAMMGNTYQNVTQKSEKEWVRQWAKIVVVLERGYSKDKLLKFQRKYSDKVDKLPKADAQYLDQENGVGQEIEYRALMVIKQTMKTKARQRKGAINNWRWMTKETLKLIKEIKSSADYHGGDLYFKDLFPDENDLLECERANRRRNSLRMINSRRSNMNMESPSLKSAIEQLAWERNLLHIKKENFSTVPENPAAEEQVEELDHLEREITSMMDESH